MLKNKELSIVEIWDGFSYLSVFGLLSFDSDIFQLVNLMLKRRLIIFTAKMIKRKLLSGRECEW